MQLEEADYGGSASLAEAHFSWETAEEAPPEVVARRFVSGTGFAGGEVEIETNSMMSSISKSIFA